MPTKPKPVKALRRDSLRCPKDKESLHFEQLQGIRVLRANKLQARCPRCRAHYEVNP